MCKCSSRGAINFMGNSWTFSIKNPKENQIQLCLEASAGIKPLNKPYW